MCASAFVASVCISLVSLPVCVCDEKVCVGGGKEEGKKESER